MSTSLLTQNLNKHLTKFLLLFVFAACLLSGISTQAQVKEPSSLSFSSDEVPEPAFSTFKVQSLENKTYLSWVIPQIKSNVYFIVERSEDRLNFVNIGFKKGVISPVGIQYSWTDNTSANTKIYYRIKKISEDGVFAVSEIQAVNGQAGQMADFK